jgi:hypothetical protein
MSLTLADYTRISSSDGFDFFTESRVVPKGFPSHLNYPAKITETIISYLYFKFHNARKSKLPAFDIDPNIALELLKAATYLGI